MEHWRSGFLPALQSAVSTLSLRTPPQQSGCQTPLSASGILPYPEGRLLSLHKFRFSAVPLFCVLLPSWTASPDISVSSAAVMEHFQSASALPAHPVPSEYAGSPLREPLP